MGGGRRAGGADGAAGRARPGDAVRAPGPPGGPAAAGPSSPASEEGGPRPGRWTGGTRRRQPRGGPCTTRAPPARCGRHGGRGRHGDGHEEPALDPAVFGAWPRTSYDLPLRAVHATLLRTGKVLLHLRVGQPELRVRRPGRFRAGLLDPVSGAYRAVDPPYDMFCAGHAQLPNGNVLVVGGTAAYPTATDGWQGSRGVRVRRGDRALDRPDRAWRAAAGTRPRSRRRRVTSGTSPAPTSRAGATRGVERTPPRRAAWCASRPGACRSTRGCSGRRRTASSTPAPARPARLGSPGSTTRAPARSSGRRHHRPRPPARGRHVFAGDATASGCWWSAAAGRRPAPPRPSTCGPLPPSGSRAATSPRPRPTSAR